MTPACFTFMVVLDLGTGTMEEIPRYGIWATTVEPEEEEEEGLELEAEDFGEVDIREGVVVAGPEAVIPLERERVLLPSGVSGMAVTSGVVTEETGPW